MSCTPVAIDRPIHRRAMRRWNQAWYFYRLQTSTDDNQTSPCLIYSYRPHRLNASSCRNLSRYSVTWSDECLSLGISSTLTSDAGTYVCGDLLSPSSTCSVVLGVLRMTLYTSVFGWTEIAEVFLVFKLKN